MSVAGCGKITVSQKKIKKEVRNDRIIMFILMMIKWMIKGGVALKIP
jgi:ribosomal protein S25